MPKKLKTFQTSLGFFDLAIAAPSMKAALEAWGADSNLFHQGAAKESHDPDIIEATMSKPGVVLRRPVGSDKPFSEHAELPRHLPEEGRPNKARDARKSKVHPPRRRDDKAARKAAAAFEKEQRQRESERRKEEAARRKQRAQRDRSVARAQAALHKAEQDHARRTAAIDAERDAVEKRSQAEEGRWEKQREKLESAIRRAHG